MYQSVLLTTPLIKLRVILEVEFLESEEGTKESFLIEGIIKRVESTILKNVKHL